MRAHQGGADEDRVGARELRLGGVCAVSDGALGDDQPVTRSPGDERQLGLAVDREARQVARVDADDLRAERDGALELGRIVRLDEQVEAELLSPGEHQARLLVAQVAEQEQRCVGPGDAGLEEVALVVEEALGEQRNRRCRPRGGEIVETASEALVHQDRDGRRPALLERRRERGGVGIGPQVAGRRRAPLDLRDRAETVLGQRLPEAPHQADGLPLREGDERLEALAGGSRVDGLSGQAVPVAEIGACPEAAIAPAAFSSTASRLGPGAPDRISRTTTAFSSGVPPARSAEEQRGIPKLPRIDLAAGDVAVDDLADEVRSRRRELVDPSGAVNHERPAGAEGRQHRGDRLHQLGRVDPDDLGPGARGIRERPEDVEHRSGRQLPADGRRMPHCRVMRLREEEAEAELVDRLLDLGWRQVEPEAERLEHVRGPRRRGHGAVSVLRHARSGRRGDQRSRGRDVERPRTVAARTGRVHEVFAARPNREHVLAHGFGTPCDLLRALSLEPEGDEEPAHLRGCRLAAHDLVHDVARLGPREVASLEQLGQCLLDGHRLPSRKFRPSAGPSGVSTDSGWNWMPTTGKARWRTAMTSPSSAVAQTSSSFVTDVAASE